MGTAVRPASTTSASWNAFSDVDAFVDEVLTELAAMAADGTRPTRSGPKPTLTGALSWLRLSEQIFRRISGAPAGFRLPRSAEVG
ncbi:hypothetical protein N825_21810 [Skermanella stibiiresistens SB22]|uniref:Uncharacterized protein n=1 Tax=Skermanella stibiiresistens SB22 TaxID=1385369 RepID=W9GT58_9PROT|nr:hypothetical protein [Skermanella stibiiresistens]EWY37085.1 hypothetical protein N825_21810 [Skermanella stibiiresistens SB22]